MGKAGIRLVKSGRVAVDAEFRNLIDRAVALDQASNAALEVVRSHTPILTGRLRAGWRAGAKRWVKAGGELSIQVINHVFYAPFVNKRGKSAGFADRAMAEGVRVAAEVIRSRRPMSQVIKYLWRKTRG